MLFSHIKKLYFIFIVKFKYLFYLATSRITRLLPVAADVSLPGAYGRVVNFGKIMTMEHARWHYLWFRRAVDWAMVSSTLRRFASLPRAKKQHKFIDRKYVDNR